MKVIYKIINTYGGRSTCLEWNGGYWEWLRWYNEDNNTKVCGEGEEKAPMWQDYGEGYI